jgi:hypothetical protein
MNSEAEIRKAINDFNAGRFGRMSTDNSSRDAAQTENR